MKTPVAYLRKSRVIDERNGVSWEVQEATVRELAALYDVNGSRLVILSDWNASGREGAKARPGYRRLLEMLDRCRRLTGVGQQRASARCSASNIVDRTKNARADTPRV